LAAGRVSRLGIAAKPTHEDCFIHGHGNDTSRAEDSMSLGQAQIGGSELLVRSAMRVT
jgi:hypothetical protein